MSINRFTRLYNFYISKKCIFIHAFYRVVLMVLLIGISSVANNLNAQTIGGMLPSDDFDGDGIINSIDLDDDNDGVLDTVEYNCTSSIMSKTGVSVSSTVTWGGTLANILDGTEAIAVYSTTTFLNQTILQFDLPAAKALSLIELSSQAGNFPLGSTGTYNIEGWNANTSWKTIATNQVFNTSTPITGTSNSYKFNMPNNYTAYSIYRISGTSVSGTVSGWVQEAYFTERTCNADIDGDGIANHLDLDSDGDGCFDAIEAGVLTTTSTGKVTGSYGSNGFANSIETIADNGIYNSVYSYSYAIYNKVNACLDSDGDGVADLVDLDDDNDGILDAIEQRTCANSPTYTFSNIDGMSNVSIKWTKKGRNLLKVANHEYNNLRYSYSIPFYKQYLSNYPNDTLALKNIAIAYQNVNQYDSALKYLEKAVSFGHKSFYLLPELLATVKKYDAAINNYAGLPDSVKTKIIDSRIYGFKNRSNFYNDSIDYKIFNTILSTPFNEYNVVPYNSGLIFESNRLPIKKRRFNLFNIFKKYEFGWDGAGYTKLYFRSNLDDIRTDSIVNFTWTDKRLPRSVADYTTQTSNDNNKFYSNYDIKNVKYNDSTVSLFKFQVGLKYNIGSVSFTSDGIRAYYTRNQLNSRGVKKLEIWESRFMNNKWTRGYKMFFNNKNYSYFHPAVTPDGKRLYYVSDEPTGIGGTDIYYIEKNNDGSWKATNNIGQIVNTEGNELFPTFYDGLFCFSSNGHPGMGGLDIYRVETNSQDEFVVKNLGYPINSTKDDLAFYMSNNMGYFSSNRNGSDDIFAFDYKNALVKISGQILTDSKIMGNTKVYLYSYDDNGKKIIEDSTFLDANSNYAFNTRPNKKYILAVFDKFGNRHEIEVKSDNYIKTNEEYNKSIALLNLPIPEQELKEIKLKEEAIRNTELAKQSKQFIRTIDSLKSLTTDYVELHHPFDQVYIIKKDLNDYYKLIERVKSLKGKKIVIVSAADCNGALEYNEDLSLRRAKRIYKSLANSNNTTMIKQVGERELLKDCSDARKDIEEQVINRYSYIFILNK